MFALLAVDTANSSFSDCYGGFGGAIYAFAVRSTDTIFENCRATSTYTKAKSKTNLSVVGGAVHSEFFNASKTNFSNCLSEGHGKDASNAKVELPTYSN